MATFLLTKLYRPTVACSSSSIWHHPSHPLLYVMRIHTGLFPSTVCSNSVCVLRSPGRVLESSIKMGPGLRGHTTHTHTRAKQVWGRAPLQLGTGPLAIARPRLPSLLSWRPHTGSGLPTACPVHAFAFTKRQLKL